MGEPVTFCRIFAVGPACPYPCADCKRSDALLSDEARRRLLAPYREAVREARLPRLNRAARWALLWAAGLGGFAGVLCAVIFG